MCVSVPRELISSAAFARHVNVKAISGPNRPYFVVQAAQNMQRFTATATTRAMPEEIEFGRVA